MGQREYNGWTNWETWNTNLWLTNDCCTSNFWEEEAREERNAYKLGKRIEADIVERIDETVDSGGIFADWLHATARVVNWTEIAQHFIDNVSADDTEDDE